MLDIKSRVKIGGGKEHTIAEFICDKCGQKKIYSFDVYEIKIFAGFPWVHNKQGGRWIKKTTKEGYEIKTEVLVCDACFNKIQRE